MSHSQIDFYLFLESMEQDRIKTNNNDCCIHLSLTYKPRGREAIYTESPNFQMAIDKSSIIAHAWRICIYCIAYPSPRSKTILTCTVALFILNHLTAATQLVVVEYKMSFSLLFLRTTLFLSLLFIIAVEISSNSGDQYQTEDDEFSKR